MFRRWLQRLLFRGSCLSVVVWNEVVFIFQHLPIEREWVIGIVGHSAQLE